MTLRTISGESLHPVGYGLWGIGNWQNPVTRQIYPGIMPASAPSDEPALERYYPTEQEYDFSQDEQQVETLAYAMRHGVNHFDGAELYVHAPELVARAMRSAGVHRKDVFLSSKLWIRSMDNGLVESAFEGIVRSFGWRDGEQVTGKPALDLLYVHTTRHNAPWRAALPQMVTLRQRGRIGYLGVSEFNLTDLIEANGMVQNSSEFAISALQVRYGIGHRSQLASELAAYCKEQDITVVAYSPLAGRAGRKALFAHPEVQAVSRDLGVTVAQLALAYCIAKDTLPIPTTTRQRAVTENLQAPQIAAQLDSEQIARLDAVRL